MAKARESKQTSDLVIEAKSGGYGVVGLPIFPPSCGSRIIAGLDDVKVPK